MAGIYGRARSNDIIPNGPIVPLDDTPLPGTLSMATYQTYGQPVILNVVASGTWNVNTQALAATGVAHAASVEAYLPVNGQDKLYFQGSGTLSATLYTSKANEG